MTMNEEMPCGHVWFVDDCETCKKIERECENEV